MRTTQQMSITIPYDMAVSVKKKVMDGAYASESEVIRDGLRALMARDRAIENWLQNTVCPTYDALQEDPTSVRSIDQVRAKINAKNPNSR